MNYGRHFTDTLQTEQAKPGQVLNEAGGYVFAVDCWTRLDRFLILGSEGGSYYATERKLTRENALSIQECLKTDSLRTVNRIAEISDSGRAPKNDSAIFALALCAASDDPTARRYALAALPKVCRIPTHLFHFVRDVKQFRGMGPALRRAISEWYTKRPVEKLAHTVLKYQSRDGWSNRDLLRLAHPVAKSPEQDSVFRWITGGVESFGAREVKNRAIYEHLPALLQDYETLKSATDVRTVCKLIHQHNYTHEMIPTQWLKTPEVWEALLIRMPQTALIRNLGRLTSLGMFTPMGATTKRIAEQIANADILRGGRVHPITILAALKVYQQGHGEKGSLTWVPSREITDALDSAFYMAFEAVEPTGKNNLLALDVSGSMGGAKVSGMPFLSAREATAAMAMVVAKTEKNWHCFGFSNRFIDLNISPKQSLSDVMKKISGLPFETTDCSLPMLYAEQNKIDVDVFSVWTDSETYAGKMHPFEALKRYRRSSGRNAKLVVCGTEASEFTIADPSDGGMLDLVGFDSSCPALIAEFSRDVNQARGAA